MVIFPTLETIRQLSVNENLSGAIDLKLGQIVDAKVIETQTLLNSFTLSVGGKHISAQTEQPLHLQPGQTLKLEVTKLLPEPTFRLLVAISPETVQQNVSQSQATVTAANVPTPRQHPENTSPQAELANLRKGQTLQAILVAADNRTVSIRLLPKEAASNGRAMPPANKPVTLETGQLLPAGTQNAETPANGNAASVLRLPAPGTRITLEVLKTGNRPVFSISETPNPDIVEQTINTALKQLLPKQASPVVLFNDLQQLLLQPDNNNILSETLKELARQLLAAIPQKNQLADAAQLQRLLQQSGLFLESKLAKLLSGNRDVSFNGDLKMKLGQFAESLIQAIAAQKGEASGLPGLKDLLNKTEAALAQLTVDQLSSLPDETAKQAWLLELPFFHQNVPQSATFEIQYEKQAADQQDEEQHSGNWAVSITITPPELATIHCRISCYGGTVNTRFWSDSAQTVEKINTHLDELKRQFESKGIKTGFMEAHQGTPTQTSPLANRPLATLLNEKV